MRKLLKKQHFYVVALVMGLLLGLNFGCIQASAGNKPFFPDKIDLSLVDRNHGYQFGEAGTKYKITNLKSSKSSVVDAEASSSSTGTFIRFSVKKKGTARITFKVKAGAKTYSYKCKVTVWPYSNPVKTLKIGNRDYASKFKTGRYYTIGKKFSGKIKLGLKAGWTLQTIRTYNPQGGANMKTYNKSPSNKITVKKGYLLDIMLYNKKGYSLSLIIFA